MRSLSPMPPLPPGAASLACTTVHGGSLDIQPVHAVHMRAIDPRHDCRRGGVDLRTMTTHRDNSAHSPDGEAQLDALTLALLQRCADAANDLEACA